MKYFFMLCLPVLLISCTRNVDPSGYIQYVENTENGLNVSRESGGVKYSLQYQPAEYMVFLEMRSLQVSPDTFNMQYQRFRGLEHYNFHIDRKAIDSLALRAGQGKSKLDYFDFGIKKDLKLIEGNDTLKCSICECESDGGIKPYYSFILGFPNKEYAGDRELLFDGKIMGVGNIKLLISGGSIKDIPQLKLI